MKVIDTKIKDVKIIEPKVFGDERGFFLETFEKNRYQTMLNIDMDFVQDNHSKSRKGVLRGLHYQLEPYAQAKLVRCIEGEVFDIAVDIRKSSPFFGKWVGVTLSAENKRQLWIPEGFAHGFVVISDTAEFVYKTNNYYSQQAERSIIFDDKDLGIAWPLNTHYILSEKDLNAPTFKKISSNEYFK